MQKKIKTVNDLRKIREELRSDLRIKGAADKGEAPVQIKVAMATCGIAAGARPIMDFFESALEKRGIDAVVIPTGCMGYCYAEPTVEVTRPGEDPLVFGEVDEARADEIIEKYIKNGEVLDGTIPVNYQSI